MIFFLAGVVTSHKLDTLLGDAPDIVGEIVRAEDRKGLVEHAAAALTMWVLLGLIRSGRSAAAALAPAPAALLALPAPPAATCDPPCSLCCLCSPCSSSHRP